MIAIVKSNQWVTDDDAAMLKKGIKEELAAAGLGDDVPVIIIGCGADMVLLGDSGNILFSTCK